MTNDSVPPADVSPDALCARLDAWGIAYRRAAHAAVSTCDEAARLVPAEVEGVHTKNLFLRDGKGRRHWLLVTLCEKSVDLRQLAHAVGADHLSLASPERLRARLGVTPGAVTVLALVHDPSHAVALLVDRDVWHAAQWRCHPLVNTETLALPREGVEAFLAQTGHVPGVVTVPVRASGDRGPAPPRA